VIGEVEEFQTRHFGVKPNAAKGFRGCIVAEPDGQPERIGQGTVEDVGR